MEGSPLAGSGWWVRAARRQREQEKVGTGGRQGGHGQVDQRAGDSGRGWQRRRRRQRGRACGQRAGLWLWRCGQRRRDWDGPSRQRQQGPHPTACNQRPNPPTTIAPEGGGPLAAKYALAAAGGQRGASRRAAASRSQPWEVWPVRVRGGSSTRPQSPSRSHRAPSCPSAHRGRDSMRVSRLLWSAPRSPRKLGRRRDFLTRPDQQPADCSMGSCLASPTIDVGDRKRHVTGPPGRPLIG